uniref:Genome polyprotein n=1 Tax=Ascaris suum TaxID=6253 RepID=F1KPM4_ASCSU
MTDSKEKRELEGKKVESVPVAPPSIPPKEHDLNEMIASTGFYYMDYDIGKFFDWILACTNMDANKKDDYNYFQGFLEGTMSKRLEDVVVMARMTDMNSVWSYIQARTHMRGLHLVKNKRLRNFVNYLAFMIPTLDWLTFVHIFEDPMTLIMDDWTYFQHLGTRSMCPACKKGAIGHYTYIRDIIRMASKHVSVLVQGADLEWFDEFAHGESQTSAVTAEGDVHPLTDWTTPGVENDGFAPDNEETETAVDGSFCVDAPSIVDYEPGFDPRDCGLVPGQKANTTDIRYVDPRTGLVWRPGEREQWMRDENTPQSLRKPPPPEEEVWAEEKGPFLESDVVVVDGKAMDVDVIEEENQNEVLPVEFGYGCPQLAHENAWLAPIIAEYEAAKTLDLSKPIRDMQEVDYTQFYVNHNRKVLRLPEQPEYELLDTDLPARQNFNTEKKNRRLHQKWKNECQRLLDAIPDMEIIDDVLVHYIKPKITAEYTPKCRQDYDELGLKRVKKPISWEDALALFREGRYNPDEWEIVRRDVGEDPVEEEILLPDKEDHTDGAVDLDPGEQNAKATPEEEAYQSYLDQRARIQNENNEEQESQNWSSDRDSNMIDLSQYVKNKTSKRRKRKSKKTRHDKDMIPEFEKLKASAQKDMNDRWFDDDDPPQCCAIINDPDPLFDPVLPTHEEPIESQEPRVEISNETVYIKEASRACPKRVALASYDQAVSQAIFVEPTLSWLEYKALEESPACVISEGVAVPGMINKVVLNPLAVIIDDQPYYPTSRFNTPRESLMSVKKILAWTGDIAYDGDQPDLELAQGNLVWQIEWAKRMMNCPRFSFIAQFQRRCAKAHAHVNECLEAHPMTSLKCEAHGWAHARDWLDYTLQIITVYYNMEPSIPRHYLLALLGTPVLLGLLESRPPSLTKRVDWIRGYLGAQYVAQGLRFQAQGPGVVSSIMAPFQIMKEWTVTSYATAKEAIKRAVNCIVDMALSLISPVGAAKNYFKDLIISVIDDLFTRMFDSIIPTIVWIEEHNRCVLATIEVLVLLVLVQLGLIEWRTAEIIVGATTVSSLWTSVFEGQAPDNPLLAAMTIITGVYYFLRPMQIADIRDRLCNLSLVLTTAGIAASTVNLIYFLIPEGLRLALKYTFGGSTAIAAEKVGMWRSKVVALNKLSGTNDVLISKEYYDAVKKTLNEGLELLRDAPQSERSNVITMMPPLMRLDHILWSYQEAKRDRPLPFVLHLSGKPGVGKTLLVHSILTHLGYSPSDVYFRPVSSEFWDGYNGQKVVVYDEFLVGAQMAERIGTEYLQLASTAHFQVPAASLENPLVGIKGTYSHPEMVITICNHVYPVVTTISDEALHRRRALVVNFEFSKDAKKAAGNTVDLKQYKSEEFPKAPWVECRIYPPQLDGTAQKVAGSKGMSFEVFLGYLTESYDQHVQVVKKLLSSQMIAAESASPSEILHRTLAEMEGVPSGPVNIFGYLAKCMGFGKSNYRGQGPLETQISIMSLKDPLLSSEALKDYLQEWGRRPGEYTLHDMVMESRNTESRWRRFARGLTITSVVIGLYLLARAIYTKFSGRNDTMVFIPEGSGEPRRKKRKARDKRYKWENIDSGSEGPIVHAEIIFPRECGLRRMTVLPVKERFVCGYLHALLGIPRSGPTLNVTLVYGGRHYNANVVWRNIVVDRDSDLVVMELENPQIPQFPSIMSKLISEDDLEFITELPVMVSLVRGGNVYPAMTTAVKAENRSYVVDETSITLDVAFIYQAETQPGDCGSMLTVRSGPYVGKIIGIHVAGRHDSVGPSYGMASVITRESLSTALTKPITSIPADAEFTSQSVEVTEIDKGQEVFLPRTSRLQYSALAQFLNYETKKPAILDPLDKRNKKRLDPVDVFIERLCPELPAVDTELLADVEAAMIHKYSCVKETVPWRHLSLEEAIMGLPGWLPSINFDSSVGIPLCYRVKKGKRELVSVSAMELRMDPGVGEAVCSFLKSFTAGKETAHWLAFLKDELVSESKIDDVRTRVIYCGDLIAMISFRMLFGSLIANFNAANTMVPHAIGLNPYSYDMDVIHQYLTEVGTKFVAGDYKDYDNRQHPQFRDLAFRVLKVLALKIENMCSETFERFADYHRKGYVQIGSKLIHQAAGNFSGSLITTILNCLINEAYVRYSFGRACPGHNFESCVRMKCLGDDHVICVRDGVNFGFSVLKERLAELGQIYTSDRKQNVAPEFRKFDEITFLGSTPVMFKGRWVGAILPDILKKMVMWTRDDNKSIEIVARTAVEYASLVPGEFYENFAVQVNDALQSAGFSPIDIRPRRLVATEIANRTCTSGLGFFGQGRTIFNAVLGPATSFVAQGPPLKSRVGTTLTTLDTPKEVVVKKSNTDSDLKAGGADHLSIEQCAGSTVQRKTFEWQNGDAPGTVLYSCSVPFGLLAQDTQESIQNMPFERFVYWKGDVELTLQINGNPFQQGLLYVYFYPLNVAGKRVPRVNWPSMLHVTLQPGVMNSAVLRIPYRFPSPMMIIQKTNGEDIQNYDLGTVCVGVMSRLRSVENESITVTMYVRFPNSTFHNPKPRVATNSVFRAQGSSQSTLTNNYIYDIKDVAGTLGISSSNSDTGQQVSGSLGLEMPLDNPPLASGSVPMAATFSGMSRSMGLEPTVPLSLNPIEADRYHKGLFDPKEQTVSFLLAQPFLQNAIEWNINNNAGSSLWKMDFNSLMGFHFDGSTQIGACPAVLNMFHYWRADLHIRLHVIKTSYHTGRLRLTAAYDSIDPQSSDSTSYFNKVFDFTELDEGEMVIPYMAPTEFRRTMDNERSRLPNYRETYGVASLSLFVVNPLKLLTTAVSNTVDILVYCWLENATVAVPRSVIPVKSMYHETSISVTERPKPTSKGDFVAQGPFPEVKEETNKPDQLNVGAKYEYRVANMLDLARRMIPIDIGNALDSASYFSLTASVYGVPPKACTLRVFPASFVGAFYAGWAGTLRYRIFMSDAENYFHQVLFVPVPLWVHGNRPFTEQDISAVAFSPTTLSGAAAGPLTMARLIGGFGAITAPNEMLAPMSASKDWIDVSVPFRSTFSFLLLPLTTTDGSISESFTETFPGSLAFGFSKPSFRIFQSVGDDFDFGIYRPPLSLKFVDLEALPKPSTSVSVAGFIL